MKYLRGKNNSCKCKDRQTTPALTEIKALKGEKRVGGGMKAK